MTQTFAMKIGRGVSLDAMELVDTRMLVCANSGGGKSHLLRLLIEQTAGRLPVIVLDPEGEFSTVRAKVNALLVGPDGDVPATMTSAKLLARRIAELRTSAVLDLYDFKAPERRQYVRTFLEALLSLPRKLWGPMLVIVDEAHKFAPEAGRDLESRDAIISLMDQGRKRGIGGILATQRLSKLAKDAAGEANNLLIGRFAQDVDLRRASEQLGFTGKSEWSTMRDFDAGEFFAVGPAFAHRGVRKIRTAKTQTDHPQSGKRHLLKPPAPTSAIKRVLKELGDLPAQVQEEADELVRLRRTVRDLQGAASKSEVSASRPEDDDRIAQLEEQVETMRLEGEDSCVKQRAILKRCLEGLRVSREVSALLEPLSALEADIEAGLKSLEVSLEHPAGNSGKLRSPRSQGGRPVGSARRRAPPRDPRAQNTSSSSGPDSIGRGAPWKIIVALLSYGAPAPRARVAILAGVSVRSSTFRNALTTLRGAGYLENAGGDQFTATQAAEDAFRGHYTPMGTAPSDLIPVWRAKLGSGVPGRVFDALVVHNGAKLSREELASQSGTSPLSSTFRNALTKLNKLGLITKKRDEVALTPDLVE